MEVLVAGIYEGVVVEGKDQQGCGGSRGKGSKGRSSTKLYRLMMKI